MPVHSGTAGKRLQHVRLKPQLGEKAADMCGRVGCSCARSPAWSVADPNKTIELFTARLKNKRGHLLASMIIFPDVIREHKIHNN
ncbi:MAG: hypothetical protein KDB01_21735 [Planctomycetaceae bacterium]|nr:hypothetical protein [Planctomycetaceae bacterium]